MNVLEKFCHDAGIDPIKAMDLLQDNEVVSDNAVYLSDVASEDYDAAFLSLWNHAKTTNKKWAAKNQPINLPA